MGTRGCASSAAMPVRFTPPGSNKLSFEMLLPETRARALGVNYLTFRPLDGCRAVFLLFLSLDVCHHLLDSALLPGNLLACLAIGREDEFQPAGLSNPVFHIALFGKVSHLQEPHAKLVC